MITHVPQVWTGGVGSFIARKSVWFWHSDTDKVMDFRNFWKGWTGGDRMDHSQLHNSQVRVIRKLLLDIFMFRGWDYCQIKRRPHGPKS